jgi:hypothetical protein
MARDLVNAPGWVRVFACVILGKVGLNEVRLGKIKLEEVKKNSKIL